MSPSSSLPLLAKTITHLQRGFSAIAEHFTRPSDVVKEGLVSLPKTVGRFNVLTVNSFAIDYSLTDRRSASSQKYSASQLK